MSPEPIYPCHDSTLWRLRIFVMKNDWYPEYDINQFHLKTIYINEFSQINEFDFFYEWDPEADGRDFDEVASYCTELGSLQYATSVSFEDFLGHVSTADIKEFLPPING